MRIFCSAICANVSVHAQQAAAFFAFPVFFRNFLEFPQAFFLYCPKIIHRAFTIICFVPVIKILYSSARIFCTFIAKRFFGFFSCAVQYSAINTMIRFVSSNIAAAAFVFFAQKRPAYIADNSAGGNYHIFHGSRFLRIH